jgi:hypothetical protein
LVIEYPDEGSSSNIQTDSERTPTLNFAYRETLGRRLDRWAGPAVAALLCLGSKKQLLLQLAWLLQLVSSLTEKNSVICHWSGGPEDSWWASDVHG